jgi:hypothetical protein
MKTIGRQGSTVLGIYLIVIAVAPYIPPIGPLVTILALLAGILILLGR